MHGLDAAFEIEKQVAVSAAQLRPRMNSHRGFGDHSQGTLAADTEMIDVDTVRRLGHDSRRQYACGRDHAQRNDHVLDLAVLIALHTGGPGGNPSAERRVQEGVWKVAEGQTVALQLLLKIGAKGAGLDA